MNPLLASAFVLGVAGSAHCVGMCGPIALAVPSYGPSRGARRVSTLLLNTGRITTYAVLGLAFGVFGQGARLAGLGQGVSIAAGALLLLAVVMPQLFERFFPTGRITLGIGRWRSLLARHLRHSAPEAIFFTGLLNGLLPCGLVYAGLIGASAMEQAWQGALFMVLFGLGTWPVLFALRLGGGTLGTRSRAWLRKASPVLLSCVAVLMILRGLGLGIPYVSPASPTMPAQVTTCH